MTFHITDYILQLVKQAFMDPVATNNVPIRLMDWTVHPNAIVYTRIVTINMAVRSLEEVYFCLQL